MRPTALSQAQTPSTKTPTTLRALSGANPIDHNPNSHTGSIAVQRNGASSSFPLPPLRFPLTTTQNLTDSPGNRYTTGNALRGRCGPMALRFPGRYRAGVRPGRGSGTISGAHQARPMERQERAVAGEPGGSSRCEPCGRLAAATGSAGRLLAIGKRLGATPARTPDPVGPRTA